MGQPVKKRPRRPRFARLPRRHGDSVSLDTPQAEIVPAGSGPGLLPVLLGGGAVGGAAALILSLHDDDNSVSK